MVGFGESVDPTAAISAILGTYPFSIGLIREILQNSDDARATKQTIVLDRRTHPHEKLLDDGLQHTQGPALLAYNNSLFDEDDWVALRRIHQSSKKTDTNKIGKYGVGFRSSYHITDSPQILSGKTLAILDPHHYFSDDGGLMVDLTSESETHYSDHLVAFDLEALESTYSSGTPFSGTVIRLPLRTAALTSRISAKILHPDEIMTLLTDFVHKEIDISMLFLSSISLIEIIEVDERGRRIIGRASINRTSPVQLSCEYTAETCHVLVQTSSVLTPLLDIEWILLHAKYSLAECTEILSQRLGQDASKILEKEKLSPALALAIPSTLHKVNSGRLFTFLPLPLSTGFPCHIHGLFALDQARQHLRNGSEYGLVKGTTDELLPEWNRVLFEVYIPRAWVALLGHLSRDTTQPMSILNAWPPFVQDVSGGDPAYWNDVLVNVGQRAISVNATIWPCIHGGPNQFASCSTVLFQAEDSPYVGVLAETGVSITVPPRYIMDSLLAGDTHCRCIRLSPQSAHNRLLNLTDSVNNLSSDAKGILLDFLLSDDNVSNLVDVPIMPCVNGTYICPSPKTSTTKTYHMLSEDEQGVFGRFCPDAISLSIIHPPSRTTLITNGPLHLNVSVLKVDTALQHAVTAIGEFGLALDDKISSASTIGWINAFWSWLPLWDQRDELLRAIASLNLIPTITGTVRPVQDVVFDPNGMDNDTLTTLMRSGLIFLASPFPLDASAILQDCGTLWSPYNLPSLLKCFEPERLGALSRSDLLHLVRHLIVCAKRSAHPLDYAHRQLLRSLPVFPVLQKLRGSEDGVYTPNIECIPVDTTIHFIDTSAMDVLHVGHGILLPSIPQVMFVAFSVEEIAMHPLLDLLSTNDGLVKCLSQLDVIRLFITHISSQMKSSTASFLYQLVHHRSSMPLSVFNSIQAAVFVETHSSQFTSPGNLIDINGPLRQLYDYNDPSLPIMSEKYDRLIIDHLSSLSLLRRSLTVDIIEERLHYLAHSSSCTTTLAVELICQLNDSSFDCSPVTNRLRLAWLPTENGRKSPNETRDHHRDHDRALFDRVWSTLLDGILVNSQSLRIALGWESNIPLEIIHSQMEYELINGTMPSMGARLQIIIKELGRRIHEIQGHAIGAKFQATIASRKNWIPIDSPPLLCSSSHAIVDHQYTIWGFHKVPVTLLGSDGVYELLLHLGCSAKPHPNTIIEELHLKTNVACSPRDVDNIIGLLKALSYLPMGGIDRNKLLALDMKSNLRPLNEVYYNDLSADRAQRLELPADRSNCHPQITAELASQLGIQTLTSLNLRDLDVDLDDEDMYEDLTRRISDVLKQYSIEQAFNEFLANAADAGAQEYDILLDSQVAPGPMTNILAPAMSEMQRSPALVLHNDAVFKESDFKGILSIGTGGKQDRSDSIGKFGLGALSAFHFTEVVMIISGNVVMFLDPSQRFLPQNGYRKRRALRSTISRMRVLYRDHLLCLAGLFGFELDCDNYEGTLFRLPLRTVDQSSTSTLSPQSVSVHRALNLMTSYWKSAPESLLFINTKVVTAWRRDQHGDRRRIWMAKATHSTPTWDEDSLVSCSTTTITRHDGRFLSSVPEDWRIVSQDISIDDLPSDFQHLIAKHKLRRISLSVATVLSSFVRREKKYRFYSRLPLPTINTLPTHVDASWVLAEDRRTIRFDESGQMNIESRFNTWLLSSCLPDLYGAFLETWPDQHNSDLWPGRSTSQDPLTQIFANAFYEHYVRTSNRRFCRTVTGCRLPYSQAIFPSTTLTINTIVNALQPNEFVLLPSRVLSQLPPDRQVDTCFMRTVISRDNARFQSAFSSGTLTIDHIAEFLGWMLDNSPTALFGLQVLPLADGSLGTIQKAGVDASATIFGGDILGHPPWSVFPKKRFLHNNMNGCALYGRDLNVDQFSSLHAVSLLEEILPKDDKRTLSLEEISWVRKFWEEFDYLLLSPEDIHPFALIQTIQPTQYVSLKYCGSDEVLASPQESAAEWLIPMFEDLGCTFLPSDTRIYTLPPTIRIKIDELSYGFRRIVEFFHSRFGASSLCSVLEHQVSEENLSQFAPYARERLRVLRKEIVLQHGKKKKNRTTTVTIERQDVARELPIWKALKGSTYHLVHANDDTLRMLPDQFSLDSLKPYLHPDFSFVEWTSNLVDVLNISEVSCWDLVHKYICFPATISDANLPDFQQVLRLILQCLPHTATGLKVPSQNMSFVHPNTLYAYSCLTFRIALDHHPEFFLHRDLRGLEENLHQFGIHSSIDFLAFKKCAETVQDDVYLYPAESVERARAVYDEYNDNLWSIIGDDMSQWTQLSTIKFIPRGETGRNVSGSSQWVVPLPAIVAPNQLVRPEFEAVAWTQRALFPTTPNQRLLLANITLGVPSVDEVVDHLCRLCFIARDHPDERHLSADFTNTYKWLQSNLQDARAPLVTYRDTPLFLNVDVYNPSIALEWTFVSASQLIFNGPDEGNRRRVGRYLSQFKNLLVAVGAQEVVSAVRPDLQLSPAEEVLNHFRKEFNSQRQNEQFTDVVLRSSDGKEFIAHRTVLAVASPHLKTLFSRAWAEIEGVVNVPEVSGDVLKLIVEYIYTGALAESEDQDILKELLEWSDAWEMKELFSIVEHRLIRTITLNTCGSVHEVGTLWNARNLMKACEDFEMANAHILNPPT